MIPKEQMKTDVEDLGVLGKKPGRILLMLVLKISNHFSVIIKPGKCQKTIDFTNRFPCYPNINFNMRLKWFKKHYDMNYIENEYGFQFCVVVIWRNRNHNKSRKCNVVALARHVVELNFYLEKFFVFCFRKFLVIYLVFEA